MAWEHTEDVYKSGVQTVLTSAQFSVLLYLAHRVHPRQHYAWPERKEICFELDLSKGAVDEAIGILPRLGFLRTHRRGFNRLNFSVPSLEELSFALSVAKIYYRRARAEHGITKLRDAQRWALRQMEHDIHPELIDEEIAPGRDLSSAEIAPGRDLSNEEIAPGRDPDRARARSVQWPKRKEKKKGQAKEKISDLSPAKRKKGEIPASAHQVWDRCFRELELQIPETTFETWVRDTSLIAASEDLFTVAAPHEYASAWLRNRLSNKIRHILRQICGRDVDVNFVDLETIKH